MPVVLAVMPPHISDTSVDPSGFQNSHILEIRGYSLGLAGTDDLTITNLRSGAQLQIQKDLDCEWQGKGNAPGSRQQYCILKVKMFNPIPGHGYEVRYLKETFRFIYKGK